MTFSNKLYDTLKWIALVFIPALDTFLGVLLPTLSVPADTTRIVLTIISAVGAFIGALIGISTAQYTANKNE